MDRAALRNLTLYWLDDVNGGYFSSTQVNVFLNNAQRQVQKILIQSGESRYIKAVQTTAVANQAFYVVPTDFLKVNRFMYILSGSTEVTEQYTDLQYITPNQEGKVGVRSGSSSFYTIIDEKFKLLPIPDAAKTMRLYYTYRVADMSNDSDEPDVPDEYHEMISLYAALDGFLKDGRDPALLMAKIGEYKKQLELDAADRNIDGPRQIVITADDMGSIY